MRWITKARHDAERGALSLEWIGLVAVMLIVVGALLASSSGFGGTIGTTVTNWIQCLGGGGAGCRPGGEGSGGEGSDPGNPDVPDPGGLPGGDDGPDVGFDPNDPDSYPTIPEPPGAGPGDGWNGGPNPPGHDPDGDRGDNEVGDPINTLSGAFVTTSVDATTASSQIGLPFTFIRSYDSTRTARGALGEGWRHSYEAAIDTTDSGDLAFTSEVGETVVFRAEDDGGWSAPPGIRSTIEETDDGHLLTRKDGRTLQFDDKGRLTVVADRFAYETTLRYSGEDLAEVTDASGATYTFAYHDGLLTTVAYPDGREVGYGYEDGLLTSVTDVDGHTTTFAYTDGLLGTSVDAEGNRTVTNTYDDQGRVVAQTDAEGGEWAFAYHDDGRTVYTDPEGNQWAEVYRRNLLAAQVNPLGQATTFRYDEAGDLVGATDANDHETTITRDDAGNVVALDGPEGSQNSWRMSYDDAHNLLTVTNPLNFTASFTYDDTGALASTIDAEDNEVTFSYDEDRPGLPVAITDPLGNTTRYVFDEAGRAVRVVAADGATTSLDYDQYGNVASVTDPLGNAEGGDPSQHTMTFAYDLGGRLVETTDALGATMGFTYDNVANLVAWEGPDGEEVTFTYDARGLLLASEESGRTTVAYGYDRIGNTTEITDAAGVSQVIDYDAASRPVALTDGAGNRIAYGRDAVGNITAVELPEDEDRLDAAARTIAISYDALNRPVRADYGDGSPSVALDWTPVGQLRELTDGATTERWSYDPNGRLDIYDADGQFFAYDYDANGNTVAETLPDGTNLTSTYDEVNRPIEIAGGDHGVQEIVYDLAGRATQITEGDDLVHELAYDALGQLQRKQTMGADGVVAAEEHSYDAVGRLISTETADERTVSVYDDHGALTRATTTDLDSGEVVRDFAYTFDEAGRRIGAEHDGDPTSFAYDDAGRLASVASSDGEITLAYDGVGNVVEKGDESFAYDLTGRMTQATTAEGTAEYTHDASGRTIGSTVTPTSGETVDSNASWSPSSGATAPTLVDPANDDPLRLLAGAGGSSTQVVGGQTQHVLPDAMGSPSVTTDPKGQARGELAFGPFGRQVGASGPGADQVATGFAGQVPAALTGLYQLDGRAYDADIGAFLQTPAGGGSESQVPNSPLALAGMTPASNTSGPGLGMGGGDPDEMSAMALPIIAGVGIVAILKAVGVGALIGGGIGAITSAISQWISGEWSWSQFLGDVLGGAIAGAFTGGWGAVFKSIAKVIAGGVLGGLIGDLISQIIGPGGFDFIRWVISGIFGGIFAGLGKLVDKLLGDGWNTRLADWLKKKFGDIFSWPSITGLVADIVLGIVGLPGTVAGWIRDAWDWIFGGGGRDTYFPDLPDIAIPDVGLK